MELEWDHLSDDELRARLEQRGCVDDEARRLVRGREEFDTRHIIEQWFAGDL